MTNFQKVQPRGFQSPGQFHGLLNGNAALDPVRDREPHRQRKPIRPCRPDGDECLQDEPDAVLERTPDAHPP